MAWKQASKWSGAKSKIGEKSEPSMTPIISTEAHVPNPRGMASTFSIGNWCCSQNFGAHTIFIISLKDFLKISLGINKDLGKG